MRAKLYRAGFLPYKWKDNQIQFLFMKPADTRYGGDKFQIAKGKIEAGESSLQAALREASEELGLISTNLHRIDLLGEYLGRTTIYVGRVKDEGLFTQPHFETDVTAWMSVDEFEKAGRDLHVPILHSAVRLITSGRLGS